jgi:hypothetical protein
MAGKKDALDWRVTSVFVLLTYQRFRGTCLRVLQGRTIEWLFNI